LKDRGQRLWRYREDYSSVTHGRVIDWGVVKTESGVAVARLMLRSIQRTRWSPGDGSQTYPLRHCTMCPAHMTAMRSATSTAAQRLCVVKGGGGGVGLVWASLRNGARQSRIPADIANVARFCFGAGLIHEGFRRSAGWYEDDRLRARDGHRRLRSDLCNVLPALRYE
jgi:hypothetical protein